MDFGPGGGGGHIDRDAIVEKRQSGQVRDDPRSRPLRPAAQGEHCVLKMPVENEAAIPLTDALAVPAVFLQRQGRIE